MGAALVKALRCESPGCSRPRYARVGKATVCKAHYGAALRAVQRPLAEAHGRLRQRPGPSVVMSLRVPAIWYRALEQRAEARGYRNAAAVALAVLEGAERWP